MTLYQNDINKQIILNTAIDLSEAIDLKIMVRKPSGAEEEWDALQYGETSSIYCVTTVGYLDEIGEYILQAFVQLEGEDGVLGDAVTITVEAPYEIRFNIPSLIPVFRVLYRYISVQTYDQSNDTPPVNTTAEILYDDFEMFTDLALDELESILIGRGSIVLTDRQEKAALCHLVADYYEMGNPDWNFRSQSMGGGVSFSRGEKTSPRDALDKMLDQIQKADRVGRRPGSSYTANDLVYTKDHKNYPDRYKITGISTFDFAEDGYDSQETSNIY
jgi:hypothetical protein